MRHSIAALGWVVFALLTSGCGTSAKDVSAPAVPVHSPPSPPEIIPDPEIVSLPSGVWTVDSQTIFPLPNDSAAAWSVIRLDTPSDRGERSYVVQVFAKCGDKSLSVLRWKTSADESGLPPEIASRMFRAPVTVATPTEAAAPAIEQICEDARRQVAARPAPVAESPVIALSQDSGAATPAPVAESSAIALSQGSETAPHPTTVQREAAAPSGTSQPSSERPTRASGKGVGAGILDGLMVCLAPMALGSGSGPGVNPIALILIVFTVVCLPFGIVLGALSGL